MVIALILPKIVIGTMNLLAAEERGIGNPSHLYTPQEAKN